MITPTRTVCYVRMLDGSLKKVSEARSLAHLWGWDFTNVKRVVVREEPVEQYHPWMVHTGVFSDLKIEPGEIRRYPTCNKNFNPANPCDCGNCCSFLGSFSYLRPIPMPRDWYQKMYQREWVNEE
ncbi:hypothetical protein [Alteromonas macleodii]